ncbi:MAG TPA: diadenylate cyclase CdaA [Bryobacteraceae bacterium]|nr:diadenylate cyclase CdaA [Bryobacteraceae bacterium]
MPQIALPPFPKLTVVSAIDILAVAVLIYNFFLMVRGRRAVHVLNGIWILLIAYLAAVWLRLDLFRSVLETLAPYTAFALIVMFQAEIRRTLARIGHSRWLGLGGQLERREVADEILLAVDALTEGKAGALIVVEREIGLRTFIESGVALDAQVSRDLLCSIFQRGGALHDGAIIIQGDRVAAAACFLPLSTRPILLRRLGTRHRAAIGITEETDALAIVVSEETGKISIAFQGELEQDVTKERVEEWLTLNTSGRAAARIESIAERMGKTGHKRVMGA